MTYRTHIEGFTGHFQTVEQIKAWAQALIARYPDLTGKTLKIWKATHVCKDGSGASYTATPSREIVIGA